MHGVFATPKGKHAAHGDAAADPADEELDAPALPVTSPVIDDAAVGAVVTANWLLSVSGVIRPRVWLLS
jgi:hypothetical protein